jgi:amino acid transporter
MTDQGAERAVTVSALIVAGVYTYRRLTEGSGPPSSGSKLAQLAGQGAPPSVGSFITAWGFTFLVISIMASINAGFGGSFAILVAVTDVLSNTGQVVVDVNSKVAPGNTTPSITAGTPQQQAKTIATAGDVGGPTSALTPTPPPGVTLK